MASQSARYFSRDFSMDSWLAEAPPIPEPDADTEGTSSTREQWRSFFDLHKSGLFFKPRTYLAVEFKAYLSCSTRALEVGCGHGCSVFPLVKSFPGMHFMATDYCDNALDILCTHPEYSPDRMQVTPWDATLPPPTSLACFAADVVLCVFALSAITPEQHVSCITHMSSLISDGGVVLFRDYGIADMTMYRHKRCLKHMLFERSDGTLAYYFTLEYLQSLADACGMSVVELEYATVLTRNRKSGLSCRRVFVHAVLRKHV